jgi:hypothetical protein
MDKGKLFDLIAVVVIALVGLLCAYITFGVLQSQADTKVQGYSLGGAIAGAIVTMSVLASVYGQFRKSSGETEDLRSRNKELEQKLIRGAPRPDDFDTHVDERQRVVLAIPQVWQPRGGLIFDFELPPSAIPPDDLVPARFWLQYSMITRQTESPDVFYDKYRESIKEAEQVESYTTEFVLLGGEVHSGVRSLKIIAHEYAEAWKQTDPLTGSVSYDWNTISKDAYQARLDAQKTADPENPAPVTEPPSSGMQRTSGAKQLLEGPVILCRMRVVCYHAALQRIFQFDFIDDSKDFPGSSLVFNQLLDSVRFLT